MSLSHDVAAIGNAIVDVIAPAEDAFLETNGIAKGAMTLVDEAQSQALYAATAAGDDPTQIWQEAVKQGLPVDELLEWAERQAANLRNEPMA